MWRRRIRDALVVLLLAAGAWMVAPPLWGMAVEAYDGITRPIFDGYVKWSDARPPRPLPERKGDRERYPRRGFGLVIAGERGFSVNTFAGTATKDMIDLPDTTIALRLSDAQLDTLYEAVIGMRLFDDPGPMPELRFDHTRSSHLGIDYTLTVRAGTSMKGLAWGHDLFWYRPRPMPDDWKRFDALLDTIGRMVRADSGYRALPAAKGIYID